MVVLLPIDCSFLRMRNGIKEAAPGFGVTFDAFEILCIALALPTNNSMVLLSHFYHRRNHFLWRKILLTFVTSSALPYYIIHHYKPSKALIPKLISIFGPVLR